MNDTSKSVAEIDRPLADEFGTLTFYHGDNTVPRLPVRPLGPIRRHPDGSGVRHDTDAAQSRSGDLVRKKGSR